MEKSRKNLRTDLKTEYTEKLITFLEADGDEVLRVKDHEIAIPVVDAEGNEDFIKLTVATPTGANKGTEPYDGYELAEDYKVKKEQKAEKEKEKAEAKAKKIAKDEAYRKKKAEAKAKRENME